MAVVGSSSTTKSTTPGSPQSRLAPLPAGGESTGSSPAAASPCGWPSPAGRKVGELGQENDTLRGRCQSAFAQAMCCLGGSAVCWATDGGVVLSRVRHSDRVTDESKIATHSDPVGRDRTNYIVKLDLTDHGMPGHFEQCWTRTDDQRLFELCCIPFFTYGQSLGDILEVILGTGQHKVESKSGHSTIRFAFTDDRRAHEQHAPTFTAP